MTGAKRLFLSMSSVQISSICYLFGNWCFETTSSRDIWNLNDERTNPQKRKTSALAPRGRLSSGGLLPKTLLFGGLVSGDANLDI